MRAFGVATLGGDMEIRFLPDGTPVGQVSLAFKLGKKGADGKYLTQWVSGSMFGKRAESVAAYMTKGSRHAFHLSDLHLDEYTAKDGTQRSSLKARIDDVEFGGGKSEGGKDSGAQNNNQAPQRQQPAASGGGSGFDDMDDDIPF